MSSTFVLTALLLGPSAAETTDPPPVDRLSLPPGFTLSLFSAAVPGARSLARGADGTLYVGTRQESVYAVQDTDGDHVADRVVVIAEGLNMPNGVAVQGEDLYVAEVGRILRWKGIAKKLSRPGKPEVVTDRYPEDRHHGWKFIAFGPDGKLYVPVGAPCNICDPDEPYAALTRINPNGGDFEIVARGIRNTVGFDWRPGTKEIWFTDNGRDHLGDTKPPCELNRITEVGQHFGYPYCHGGDIPDPEFGKKRKCSEFRPPARRLVAHAAPVGMRFYTGKSFPSKYQGRIFVAEHGSWNRSRKVGYRVMTASVDTAGQVVAYEPFISGWLDEEAQQAWGRPVDVLVMPDGALLVSDDRAGAIYRVHHAGT